MAEKFGVPPDKVIEVQALAGDSVDNVPGVPKVGPKTAAKWLAQYGSLDAIIENAADVGGKVGENLRASLDQLPLSRELVTIRLDVDIGRELADLRPDLTFAELRGNIATRLEKAADFDAVVVAAAALDRLEQHPCCIGHAVVFERAVGDEHVDQPVVAGLELPEERLDLGAGGRTHS